MQTSLKVLNPGEGDQQHEVIWFAQSGCVTHYVGHSEVHVNGLLIGRWEHDEPGQRNLLVVRLAENEGIHLGKLASAFKVSTETLRQMRKQAQDEGLEALLNRKRGGSRSKVTAKLKNKLERWFAKGLTAAEAHRRLGPTPPIGGTTVWRVYRAWLEKRPTLDPLIQADSSPDAQTCIPGFERPSQHDEESGTDAGDGEIPARRKESGSGREAEPEDGEPDDGVVLEASEIRGGRDIQHLGTWILIALVYRLGLYSAAAELVAGERRRKSLRMALDAVIAAFAVGQKCVEGVRRLATLTAPRLLRVERVPSASWVRRILHWFADTAGSARFHLSMVAVYLAMAKGEDGGSCVFYVDNHMRPYTGKHTLRRGWRMQDKRALPGATDYYVHDEDGRPVLRIDVAQHGSLTRWLRPIARIIRQRLNSDERVLLAFDRAGAHPEEMAELRDEGFEFVTYERKPYRRLLRTAFTETLIVGDQEVQIHESRLKNLKKGRGRVRRICVLTEDGNQVNLLANSRESAERLVSIMMLDGGRWVQENAFKYGNERWGINHLDGRQVETYPPSSIIPNPARRRLERALRIARNSEGAARCKLERLPLGHKRRPAFEKQLADALAQQARLEAQRAHTPAHIALEDSELTDTLVKHSSHYKTVLDTIRIACANAESELAYMLAPELPRAAEAKKTLANLFAAPGDVRVRDQAIHVVLQPAASPAERLAFNSMLTQLDRHKLILPGDPRQRPLRFRVQLQ